MEEEEVRIQAIWYILAYIAGESGCSDKGDRRLISRGLEFLSKEKHLDIWWERWLNAYVIRCVDFPDRPPIGIRFIDEEEEGEVSRVFDWIVLASGTPVNHLYDDYDWGNGRIPPYDCLRDVVQNTPFMKWASLPIVRTLVNSALSVTGVPNRYV